MPEFNLAPRLRVDLDQRVTFLDGIAVPLTRTEFKIFALLHAQQGAVVPKDQILSRLYPEGTDEAEMKIIDVLVCYIRRKLNAIRPGARDHIETVWGRGYVLRDGEAPALGIAA